MTEPGYNERLFTGGIRKWLHDARFTWLTVKCREFELEHRTVLELGCFDARSIAYLPTPPVSYYGFDANWEGGLDNARNIWGGNHRYVFQVATRPEDMHVTRKFDLCLCLETIEHVPAEQVSGYLHRLSEALTGSGAMLMTVPNEKGLVFLAKYLAQKLFLGGSEHYSAAEVVHATLGRLHRIRRREHKGFDWQTLAEQLAQYFVLVQVQGIQFPRLPVWANAQVGFVLRPRRT